MAREDIRLEVIGDIEAYAKAVGKIPGVTEKEAEKAAKAFVKSQQRAQIKAALEAEKAAKNASGKWAEAGMAAAKGFGAGFGTVIAAVGSVAKFVDVVAEARLELDAMSRSTGVSLETLGGLKTAADLANLEFQDVTKGIENFGEKMVDASHGSGSALDAFEALGISQEELKTRFGDTDGVLREVIAKMQGTEDAALRNALAQQLFGDAGNKLTEALGNVPLDTFIDQASRLGNEVTPKNVAEARAWKVNLEALKGELMGTGAALSDFLEFGPLVENATLGFVFLKNVGVASVKELTDSWLDLALAAEAFIRGDFADARELLDRATGFDAIGASIEDVADAAMKETKAFFDLREAAKQVGTATSATKTEIAQLTSEKDKAAKASKELAREEEQLAKKQREAAEELAQIIGSATEDELTAEGKILRARAEQLEQIDDLRGGLLELHRQGVDVADQVAASFVASSEVVDRAERELAAERLQRAADERHRAEDLAELRLDLAEEQRAQEEADHEARVERQLEAIELVEEAASIAFDTLSEVSRRAQDAAEAALDEQRELVAELKEERAELKEQLLEDLSEVERAAVESRLRQVEAELEAAKAERKSRRESALEAWRAGQGLALSEIAFNTAAAVIKAFALFGPPPSPVGIASAALAGAAGATQAGLVLTEKPPQFHDGGDGNFPVFTGGPDERSAVLRQGEPVLNARAADNLGRENIQRLQTTGRMDAGGGEARMGLFFNGRQIDQVLVRTLDRGGRARGKLSRLAKSRPTGQVSVFSTSR